MVQILERRSSISHTDARTRFRFSLRDALIATLILDIAELASTFEQLSSTQLYGSGSLSVLIIPFVLMMTHLFMLIFLTFRIELWRRDEDKYTPASARYFFVYASTAVLFTNAMTINHVIRILGAA